MRSAIRDDIVGSGLPPLKFVAVTANGRQLVASYRASSTYRRWDISDRNCLTELDLYRPATTFPPSRRWPLTSNCTPISAGQDGRIVLTTFDSADGLGEMPTAIARQTRDNTSDAVNGRPGMRAFSLITSAPWTIEQVNWPRAATPSPLQRAE